MNSRISAPKKHQRTVNVWVDEAIWGHRFYNDQTPWLVFLEFLAVFQSRRAVDRALNEPRQSDEHESFEYYIPKMIPSRELIFNNPRLQSVEGSLKSDHEKWDQWLKSLDSYRDFRYLQERFRSFTHFARVIEFFQTTAIERHRQRRWSSRFLFPYGPNCIYPDLPSNVNRSPDRRFFARGGELLYLMLSRSGRGREIAETICEKLLRKDSIWNRVVSILLPEPGSAMFDTVSSDVGYLPFRERREYGELADIWQRLLKLDLPGESLLDPLMRLTVLQMLLYVLRRAKEELGESGEPKIVLEIASPKRTTLFELSAENLGANRMLPARAVRAYVQSAKDDHRWHQASQAEEPCDAVTQFLKDRYAWKHADTSTRDPDGILATLVSYAEERHQQHVAKVHLEWARQIGLAVSRRGSGTWYSPDDALLKALVVCVVEDGREEYHRFIGKLYERFNLVIGPAEAERAYGALPTDQNVFLQNTQRLEQRLKTLGLLRRLSDDCAYVENPFGSKR